MFVAEIAAEKRIDKIVEARTLKMYDDGRISRNGSETSLPISEDAFLSMMNRLGVRGARYLADLNTVRRARNFDEDILELIQRENAAHAERAALARMQKKPEPAQMPRELKLRMRGRGPRAEIFGAVSPTYAAFDCDKIAQALSLAAPKDARGTVVYDGTRSRFEVMFHSNIEPERFVAGEFFKAGVLVRTDDTGAGGIRVSSTVWQNLCLNLIILDKAEQRIDSLRHIGSIEALAKRFEESFRKALSTITHFRKAWGYALDDDLCTSVGVQEQEALGLSVHDLMRGIFNGLVERELVPVSRAQSKRDETVGQLMTMWEKDTSAAAGPTRAAAVNAVTRPALLPFVAI